MQFARRFSLVNFTIGTSALLFQVFVLYPWHERLDADFQDLKKEHIRVLEAGRKERLEELRRIRTELEQMRQEKGKWWFGN